MSDMVITFQEQLEEVAMFRGIMHNIFTLVWSHSFPIR